MWDEHGSSRSISPITDPTTRAAADRPEAVAPGLRPLHALTQRYLRYLADSQLGVCGYDTRGYAGCKRPAERQLS